MDWTNIYWDKLGGEKHLSILPNTHHSLTIGMLEIISLISTWSRSIAAGNINRPTFEHTYDNFTGEITVIVPKDQI